MADNKILLRTNFSATLLPRLFLLIEFNVVLAQVRACAVVVCLRSFTLTLCLTRYGGGRQAALTRAPRWL